MPLKYNIRKLPPLPRDFSWNRPIAALASDLGCGTSLAWMLRMEFYGHTTAFKGRPKPKLRK